MLSIFATIIWYSITPRALHIKFNNLYTFRLWQLVYLFYWIPISLHRGSNYSSWGQHIIWKTFFTNLLTLLLVLWCHSLSSSCPFLPDLCHPHSFYRPTPTPVNLPPPHTHPPPNPLQVSVPVVLQRRPDAVGELGLQHGGAPASCPPPRQHHTARQWAGSAVDRRAPPAPQQHQGAPPVCPSPP